MLDTPAGGRLWRFKYKRGGVEKLLTLGQYPEVSLKRAREKRDDARRQLSDGVDPTLKRRAEEDPRTAPWKSLDASFATRLRRIAPSTISLRTSLALLRHVRQRITQPSLTPSKLESC